MSKNKKTVILLLIAAVLIAVVPLFVLKEAEFGGSDDAGSVMVEEIHGEYEPWFTPVLETALDRELPGEIESLIFCIQTGIGVGIIAFIMGRFVERKKWTDSLGSSFHRHCKYMKHDQKHTQRNKRRQKFTRIKNHPVSSFLYQCSETCRRRR